MRVARKSWKKALAKALVLVMALAGAIAIGAPAQASTFKSIQLQGYDQGSSNLNSTIRFRITSFVKKNPELTVLTCIGFDDTKGQGESELGKNRAITACAQALASNPDLRLAKTIGKFDQTEVGFNNRRVVMVLSNQKDPIMMTYFNHNDGTKTRASYSSSAGNEIVLPTPSREGYQFVGWYAKKGKGALVGMGGERFVPRKDSTLLALWVLGAESVGGGGSPNAVVATETGFSSYWGEYNYNPLTAGECVGDDFSSGHWWSFTLIKEGSEAINPNFESSVAGSKGVDFCFGDLSTYTNFYNLDYTNYLDNYYNISLWISANSTGLSVTGTNGDTSAAITQLAGLNFDIKTSDGLFRMVLSRPY